MASGIGAVTCIILLCVCLAASADDTLVQTTLGPVRGYADETAQGRKFFAFNALPYAKPPLGDLRFKVLELMTFLLRLYVDILFIIPCHSFNC